MTFETRVNLSIKLSDKAEIERKAQALGLSLSAFMRQAALLYEVKGAPVTPMSEAPKSPGGDSIDQSERK